MAKFKISPVVFNEEDHSYFLGEKRLTGITGLIHDILGLGVYPEAGDYVKGYTIPRAGSRGTAVHHAIQTYDQLGLKVALQRVPTTYFKGKSNEYLADEEWNVGYQLECYIHNKETNGFEALANELTVSDNEKYASQIDNVWRNKETGGIWLVDTKTNNLDLYPICGYFNPNYFTSREDALKEYLSWQLSVYAVLFESENPDIRVEGLACNWLREDTSAFWVIERKPDDLVRELLSSTYEFIDGVAHHFHPNLAVFGISKSDETLPVAQIQTLPEVPQDVVEYVTSLIHAEKELKEKIEQAKAGLRKAMEAHEVKTFDFGTFKATIAADSERTTFETAKFKKDYPELYAQYTTKKTTKGGFTLKAKEQ